MCFIRKFEISKANRKNEISVVIFILCIM